MHIMPLAMKINAQSHLSDFHCETHAIFPDQLTSLPHVYYCDVQHSTLISFNIDIPKHANKYVHKSYLDILIP